MKSIARPAVFALAVALAASGCTCAKKNEAAPAAASASPIGSASASAAPSASASAAAVETEARYSNPIAAARIAGGTVIAAALVADAHAIEIAGFDGGATPRFTRPVFANVTWSTDAELHVLPAAGGAVIVWRGAIDGKVDRYAVTVSATGEVTTPSSNVGSALCATGDGLAWLERRPGEPVHARYRAFADAATRELAKLAADPTPSLVCADHAIYAAIEDDDQLRVIPLDGGEAGAPLLVIKSESPAHDDDADSDSDEDHRMFTYGDALGVLRVGAEGALSLRELKGRALGDWTPIKARLSGDDDMLIDVDGDDRSFTFVFSRDRSESCKDLSASARSVHAVRVDRATRAEARFYVVPAVCGRVTGPFWLDGDRGRLTWVERGRGADAKSPPIVALSSRALVEGSKIDRVDLRADAVAFAGCDASGCAAVALVRPGGADGMTPEPMRLVRFGR